MNAEDALAAIKDVEKPGDKGRKEDDRRGPKSSVQIDRSMTGVKGRMRELLKW